MKTLLKLEKLKCNENNTHTRNEHKEKAKQTRENQNLLGYKEQ